MSQNLPKKQSVQESSRNRVLAYSQYKVVLVTEIVAHCIPLLVYQCVGLFLVTRKRKRNWLALELRTAQRKKQYAAEGHSSLPEQLRIHRKLGKYRQKYASSKTLKPAPWGKQLTLQTNIEITFVYLNFWWIWCIQNSCCQVNLFSLWKLE